MTIDYKSTNRNAWNKRTAIHLESQFYDVQGFKEGKSSLNEIELSLMGDVSNLSLLHLQCHFGQDTLSWARLGAKVTGVDLSDVAISNAITLAEELAINANFICADVLEYADEGMASFDRVFASYGTICWLPDLDKWATTVCRHLKPGGKFCFVEFHPLIDILQGYAYFHQQEPDVEDEGTYTENCTGELSTTACWSHPISDVISALIKQGLEIESFNEYDFSPYPCFEQLIQDGDNRYVWRKDQHNVPLVYSIVARKPTK